MGLLASAFGGGSPDIASTAASLFSSKSNSSLGGLLSSMNTPAPAPAPQAVSAPAPQDPVAAPAQDNSQMFAYAQKIADSINSLSTSISSQPKQTQQIIPQTAPIPSYFSRGSAILGNAQQAGNPGQSNNMGAVQGQSNNTFLGAFF